MKKPLIILAGPTAVGKTDVSIGLAKMLGCEIVSADSMLVYKYMDIGTAKPSPEEMDGIRHYLIDVVYPDEEYSVAVFRETAGQSIEQILSKNKLPLVAGGTGLYINSLTYNLVFSETISDTEYRKELQELAAKYGNSYIHEMLQIVDPESYNRLHPNDTKRVIRALEVYKQTGTTMSELNRRAFERPIEYNLCMIGLTMDRQKLYERINLRVDKMIEGGLIEEVKGLLDMGYSRNLISMQGLGYKEMAAYICGECSLSEGVDRLKQSTRNFAKRQLTWFRREKRIHWINVDSFNTKDSIIKNIAQYIEGKLVQA